MNAAVAGRRRAATSACASRRRTAPGRRRGPRRRGRAIRQRRARHAERFEHGLARDSRPPASRSPRRAPRRPARCRCWSRSGCARAWRPARRPSNAYPPAWLSRCRSVQPGWPTGSSRSRVPSSTATRIAQATSGLVIEASRKVRAGVADRVDRPRPACDDGRGDVVDRPVDGEVEGSHSTPVGRSGEGAEELRRPGRRGRRSGER